MVKKNNIGKLLNRFIAGILVFAIAFFSYPEMKEIKADGESSIRIEPVASSGGTFDVYADSTDTAVVEFYKTGLELDTDNSSTGSSEKSAEGSFDRFTFSGIARGTSNSYTFTYRGTAMNVGPYTVTVVVHGRKLENDCTVSARSYTIDETGANDYAASSVITAKNNSRSFSFEVTSLEKDNSSIDASSRPLHPGSYSATVAVNGGDEYENCNKTVTFTVEKYTPTLSIPDVTTGGEPHPSFTIFTNDFATYSYNDSVNSDGPNGPSLATVYYKGENDSSYTAVKPTAPGTYSAKLMFTDMQESNEFNKAASTTFKISLKEGKGTVTVKDTVYGESSVKPEAKSDTNDADKAEFFYKVKNTDDSTYTKDRPTKPGNYVCKAVFPKTGDYDKCEATCIFTIDRGKGVGSLTASDVYVGMEPKTTPTSATNGTTAVKYYYKEKSEDASKYTDKLPTKPGEYTVKAVFPMTDYYYETSAEASFKTSYMPAPTFGLTGKQGKNDFYTDTVSVKAPAGYEVSLSYGKDYKDSINILDGVKYVYFKNTKTGALSDKAAVPAYKMDSLLPVVKGVKNNDTIFKDEYELEITDDNLEMVKVNDQTVPVKDGKATYKLTSDSGEMLYKIEATDQAGHTVTYTITVASPWVEDGFVPAGQIVKLKPGKAYSLKSGKKYKIKGDDTVYNGGSKFYVDKETSLELEEVQ